jgi:hypothetical protein
MLQRPGICVAKSSKCFIVQGYVATWVYAVKTRNMFAESRYVFKSLDTRHIHEQSAMSE